MFKLIQKETNQYATQQINKKKQDGSLKPKSVFAQWNTASLQEIKKFFFSNHTHERVTQVICAGLLEFASDYPYPICTFRWHVSR
jgi:hypothetical protein